MPFALLGHGGRQHRAIKNTRECVTSNPFIINISPQDLIISQWAPPWRVSLLHVFFWGVHSDQYFKNLENVFCKRKQNSEHPVTKSCRQRLVDIFCKGRHYKYSSLPQFMIPCPVFSITHSQQHESSCPVSKVHILPIP